MMYRKVERIDRALSVVGFGCWSSGGYNWTDGSVEESIRAIHAAIDHGVNLFDVAPVYGFGDSEQVLGRALKGRRSKVFIATKVGLRWDVKDGPTRNDLSQSSIRWEIEQSLRRLNVEYVDLYQMHWPDPNTPIEETMQTMADLVREGKIRHIGASNFSIALCDKAERIAPLASHQVLYNMFDRNAKSYCGIPLEYKAEQEALPHCAGKGMAFLPYSPLCQGVLSGRFYRGRDNDLIKSDMRLTNPELLGDALNRKLDAVDRLKAVANNAGLTLLEMSMGWLIHQPAVTSIISGARNEAQAISSAKTGDVLISADIMREIGDILDEYEQKEAQYS